MPQKDEGQLALETRLPSGNVVLGGFDKPEDISPPPPFQSLSSVTTSFLSEVARRAIDNHRRRSLDQTLPADVRQAAAQNAAGIIKTCLQHGILEAADVH